MYHRFPSFRPNPTSETKTAREYLSEILSKSDQRRRYNPSHNSSSMPSSKGKPTDPKLREEVKEEVKQESKGEVPSHPPSPPTINSIQRPHYTERAEKARFRLKSNQGNSC